MVLQKLPNEPSIRLNIGKVRWRVVESYRDFFLNELLPGLSPDDTGSRRTVIKHSSMRTVTRLELASGRMVYVKQYRTDHWVDKLVCCIAHSRSRARTEWRAFRTARHKASGVLVPKPIAVADMRVRGILRESWLVTEVIPSETILRDELSQQNLSSTERDLLLSQLGKLTFQLAEAGLYHRDYEVSNVLVCRAKDDLHLAVLDMHSTHVKRRCYRRQFNSMLAQMWMSLEEVGTTEEELCSFVRNALPEGARGEPSIRSTRRTARQLTLQRWASRTHWCLEHNTLFAHGRIRGGRYSVVRPFGLNRLTQVVNTHKKCQDDKTVATLKTTSRGQVTVVRTGDNSMLCVKETRSTGIDGLLKGLLRQSRGRRAWLAVNGLAPRGIPGIQSFGYLYERTGILGITEYVVTEFVKESITLEEYVENFFENPTTPEQRRELVRELARYVARLHQCGVYQDDLKAENVLVRDLSTEQWEFYLIDWDGVRFVNKMSTRRRVTNLAQLAAALPNTVSCTHRLRFLREYASITRINWNEHNVIEKIIRIARARRHRWRI